MARLKPADFNSVRDAVRKLEGTTRAELVPLVVADAGEYGWIKYQTALFGFGIALVLGEAWSILRTWPLDAQEVTLITVAGILLGGIFGMVPTFARLVLMNKSTTKIVHRRALAEFTHFGCGNTRERIGILVMVALFERRIEIIADSGIQSVVVAKEGPEVWTNVAAAFSKTAAEGRAVEGMISVIDSIGAILSRHFLPDANRPNELSDELRTDE
jgi:putative membrane protein